jgi:hypothetical protein
MDSRPQQQSKLHIYYGSNGRLPESDKSSLYYIPLYTTVEFCKEYGYFITNYYGWISDKIPVLSLRQEDSIDQWLDMYQQPCQNLVYRNLEGFMETIKKPTMIIYVPKNFKPIQQSKNIRIHT